MVAESIRVNGYDVTYVEKGQGIPLLLVHGSLCDYRYWEYQMEPLARVYRVVALSLRRHYPEHWDGKSNDFTARQHMEDIAAFIAALDVGPVHLLGHSRGGNLAFHLARNFPDRVRSLVLADPNGALDETLRPAQASIEATRLDPTVFRMAFDQVQRGNIDEGLGQFVNAVNGPGYWEAMNDRLRQFARDNVWTLAGLLTEKRDPYSRDAASAIMAPTLLIGGEKSPPPCPGIIAALERSLPTVRRVTIPRASHGMNVENPAAFNAAVLDFLA